jgi:glycosyltransferase involved in cell wall biosynthesis
VRDGVNCKRAVDHDAGARPLTPLPPRVTVGVPVYNGARHLGPCLESLISQTYDNLEIVISDNASTDETPDICRLYAEKDDRVRYYRQPRNLGVAGNYRTVVQLARGELFKWSAHDDVCAPEFVERCVSALDRSPEHVLAFPKFRFIDDAGDILLDNDAAVRWRDHSKSYGRLGDILSDRSRNLCKWQFGVVRKDVLLRTGLIGNYNASDEVLMAELALLGGFVEVGDYLFFSRIHENSSMEANSDAVDLARWYDPEWGGLYPMARTRVLCGWISAIAHAPVPLHEKIAGLVLLVEWFISDRHWRVIGGEMKRNVIGRAMRNRFEQKGMKSLV